ncbi:hypothetical protein LUZ60_007210 [Juncus effusus]|nr:hypothetical protein LUZ60_007210 [Juncus effusus]
MDWSELSPDLLRLIAKRLGEISNFVRFRVVCKHWRSAVLPCDLPPQLPWFLLAKKMEAPSSEIKFYSLYSNKIHTVHVPEVNMNSLIGASNKYLFLSDLKCMSAVFFNPLTRSQIRVPYRYWPFSPIYTKRCHNHGPNPIGNNIFAALFMKDPEKCKHFLCLCLSDDGEWTKVEVPRVCNLDATYFYKGNLFIWDLATADTRVVDITTGDVVSVISDQGINFDYLIQACDDLLGVVQLFKYYDPRIPIEECRFKVYRLEQDGKTPSWAELSQGLGDLMLFLDRGNGFCLKASDFDGFKGNTIYFWKWHRWSSNQKSYECNDNGFALSRYDLEEDCTEVLMYAKDHEIDPNDIWLLPSLC